MSTSSKAELNQSRSDADSAEDTQSSSAASWETPVSTRLSSSSSWDTPKSSGEDDRLMRSGESEPVVDRTEQVIHGTEQVVDGTEQLIDGTEQVIDGTEQLIDETEQVIDETERMFGTEPVSDGIERMFGTEQVSDGTKRMFDTEQVTDKGLPDEEVADDDVINERTLTASPHSTVLIPDDDPPPYTEHPSTSWSPLRSIQSGFRTPTIRHTTAPELANLIPKQGVNVSPVSIAASRSTERTFRIRPSPGMSFRIYPDEHPGDVKERDTFAQKYGTVCIVAFFVIFLMVLSLIAKFLVKTTLRP